MPNTAAGVFQDKRRRNIASPLQVGNNAGSYSGGIKALQAELDGAGGSHLSLVPLRICRHNAIMDAIDFLNKSRKGPLQPVYVLTGDEEFLKRQARAALVPQLLDDADPSFALSAYSGDQAEWSTILGELQTLPFLAPRRVVVIEQADPFVTEYRQRLEKYLLKPSAGVLILDVRTWPANTKLAKAIPDQATIVCKAPKSAQLPVWCVQRARSEHGKELAQPAVQLLVELIEPSLGLLDQELAKLAVYVGDRAVITPADVDALVGRSRNAETFKIFDEIGRGNAGGALSMLQHLLADGADPIQILGAFSWQLRRLAKAGRLVRDGLSPLQALTEVGVNSYFMANWQQQLKQLGPRRLEKLYDWLLEVDLGMKGNSTLAPTTQLERLIVRLSRPTTKANA
jgi:DNA polymerase III subunit delta